MYRRFFGWKNEATLDVIAARLHVLHKLNLQDKRLLAYCVRLRHLCDHRNTHLQKE